MFRVFAICAALLLGAQTPASANPAECKRLAEASPLVLNGVSRQSIHDFETDHPGAGYSVAYKTETETLSFFFFDGGHASLDDTLERIYFDGAVGDVQKMADQMGLSLGDIRAFHVGRMESLLTYVAEVTDSRSLFHVIGLGRNGGCLVKVRFTSPMSEAAARAQFWQQFRRWARLFRPL